MSSSRCVWIFLVTVLSVSAADWRDEKQGDYFPSPHSKKEIEGVDYHGHSGERVIPTRGVRVPGKRRHTIPRFPSPWPPRKPAQQESCRKAKQNGRFTKHDRDVINSLLNVEYLSAEFFLYAGYGHGMDMFDAELSKNGPVPVGGEKANIGHHLVTKVAKEIGDQGMGHIRLIHEELKEHAISRPDLNISKTVWANFLARSLEQDLFSPYNDFNPYNDTLSFLVAAYVLPYAALSGYFGLSAQVVGQGAKKLVGGLLSVTSAQEAVLRTLLYQHRQETLKRYNLSVSQIAGKLSEYCAKLVQAQDVNEEHSEPMSGRPEHKLFDSIVAVNEDSLPFRLSARQVFGLLYASGNASVPGGFFPKGAHGKIANRFLQK